MEKVFSRLNRKNRIHRRVRKKLSGTAERPRLAIFRSGKHIYAQAVDDIAGRTLAFASTQDKAFVSSGKSGSNRDGAELLGQVIAKRCLDKGIKTIVFDRGGYLYHGRIKALADASRKGGLEF